MAYKVIRYFEDLQDNNHPYTEGDIFPREGLSVSDNRIKELSGSDNLQKTPLIRKIRERTTEPKNSGKRSRKNSAR